MGLMKTGMNKLASFVPGSIGAKAKGALQTGGNANAMYKEFYTYLGQKGLKPTTASISAFLKTKGVSDAIIKQHVSAAASGGAAKYPQGGSGEAPAASGGADPAQTAASSKSPGFNVKLPQRAPTQAAPQPQVEPAAQATTAPEQPASQSQATQKSDWAEKGWRSKQKLAPGVHKVPPPPGTKLAEEIQLKRLLSKISKRL
jgi:hypothetical protein